MSKQSAILVIVGVVILVVAYFGVSAIGNDSGNEDNSAIQNHTSEDNTKTIEINVKDEATEAVTERIKQGQEVEILLNSGVDDEAHLHGYDLLVDLKKGSQARIEFTADKTGRFELETESDGTLLAIFEVYP